MCHLVSKFSSKVQSSMTISRDKSVGMENRPIVDESKVSWDDNVCKSFVRNVNKKIYHIDIKISYVT